MSKLFGGWGAKEPGVKVIVRFTAPLVTLAILLSLTACSLTQQQRVQAEKWADVAEVALLHACNLRCADPDWKPWIDAAGDVVKQAKQDVANEAALQDKQGWVMGIIKAAAAIAPLALSLAS